MNRRTMGLALAFSIIVLPFVFGGEAATLAQCSFTSGSTGVDGAFAPTADITVPLPPDGILNYTTVNIPSSVTVRFQKNVKNTPVFLLATGNISIAGTVDVSGSDSSGPVPGKGGPGSFDGGFGGVQCGGAGLGPGGGAPTCPGGPGLGSGGFGTTGSGGGGGAVYGNNLLVPLIGGSGGGAGANGTSFGQGGGGGGGAILIASSTRITLSGSLRAKGGTSQYSAAGGGSGGAIRVVAGTLAGNGSLSVEPGLGCQQCYYCQYDGSCQIPGGEGRARLETCQNEFTGSVPASLSFGLPGPVLLAGIPALSITSIAGVAAPVIPAGSFTLAPDISLPIGTTTATVQLAATGIPVGTTVSVSVEPQYGLPSTVTSTPLSGSQQSSIASADVTLSAGLAIVSAQTTVTVTAQAGSSPIVVGSINGEKIEKIRVAATYGGPSSISYITASGREIGVE